MRRCRQSVVCRCPRASSVRHEAYATWRKTCVRLAYAIRWKKCVRIAYVRHQTGCVGTSRVRYQTQDVCTYRVRHQAYVSVATQRDRDHTAPPRPLTACACAPSSRQPINYADGNYLATPSVAGCWLSTHEFLPARRRAKTAHEDSGRRPTDDNEKYRG